MIKSRLLIFSLLFSFSAFSQTKAYHPFPDSAFWRVDYDYYQPYQYPCFAKYYFHYFINGDTLINSSVHKKLYRSYVYRDSIFCAAPYSPPGSPPSGYVGALKDDSVASKAFFVPPNKTVDSLLYDYNLAVGDTMKGYTQPDPAKMVVTSIDSVLIEGQYRRRWHFTQCYSPSPYYPYVIQGIGSSCGLIEPLCTYIWDFTYRYLVCVEDSSGPVFISGVNSAWGCLPILSELNEISPEDRFQIFPNPSTGNFTLTSSRQFQFSIHDIFGREVYQSLNYPISQSITLDLSSQPKGIYFIRAKTKEGIVSRKVILQ